MKRRAFLTGLAATAGALIVPRRVYSFASELRVPSEPWTLGIDKMPGETDREFVDRMLARQVLGRDPIAQAMISGRVSEDKMPGMRGRIIVEDELVASDDIQFPPGGIRVRQSHPIASRGDVWFGRADEAPVGRVLEVHSNHVVVAVTGPRYPHPVEGSEPMYRFTKRKPPRLMASSGFFISDVKL